MIYIIQVKVEFDYHSNVGDFALTKVREGLLQEEDEDCTVRFVQDYYVDDFVHTGSTVTFNGAFIVEIPATVISQTIRKSG